MLNICTALIYILNIYICYPYEQTWYL